MITRKANNYDDEYKDTGNTNKTSSSATTITTATNENL